MEVLFWNPVTCDSVQLNVAIGTHTLVDLYAMCNRAQPFHIPKVARPVRCGNLRGCGSSSRGVALARSCKQKPRGRSPATIVMRVGEVAPRRAVELHARGMFAVVRDAQLPGTSREEPYT